jgi:hypothetical protein
VYEPLWSEQEAKDARHTAQKEPALAER